MREELDFSKRDASNGGINIMVCAVRLEFRSESLRCRREITASPSSARPRKIRFPHAVHRAHTIGAQE